MQDVIVMIFDRYVTTLKDTSEYDYRTHKQSGQPTIIEQNVPCNVTHMGMQRVSAIFGSVQNVQVIRTYHNLKHGYDRMRLDGDTNAYILRQEYSLKNGMNTYIAVQDVSKK